MSTTFLAMTAAVFCGFVSLLGCAGVLGLEAGEPHEGGEAGASGRTQQRGGGGHSASEAGADAGGRSSTGADASSGGPPTGDSDVDAGAGGLGGSPAADCGDGALDPIEECDGADLDGASCTVPPDPLPSFAGGTLRCTAQCKYDLSGCYTVRTLGLSRHVCAVLSNDQLKCWGDNRWGQLGLGDLDHRGEEAGEMGENLPFVDLSGRAVVEVAVGAYHTCALLQGNEVVCWGDNQLGQLGVASVEQVSDAAQATPVDLGEGAVEHISAGVAHNCATFVSGRVKCWGYNLEGELGLGHAEERGKVAEQMGDTLPFLDLGFAQVVELDAGDGHTCARDGVGALKCWGDNWFGQLGLGVDEMARGESPNEMGSFLLAVDLGTSPVQTIAAGGFHTCALLSDATIKCWGMGADGQLGYEDSDARGVSPQQMGPALPIVDLGAEGVVGVTAGYRHSCAWLTGQRVKCWGINGFGQLGVGDWDSRGDYEGTMGEALPFVNLGEDREIVSVHAGYNITCAVLDAGRVKCWGFNQEAGALGAGHSEDVGIYPEQMGDALPFVAL